MDLKDLNTGGLKETMSLNFNNGTITGEFKKINSDNGSVITGTCDEKGYLHGKVVTKEFDEEMIREFSHGIMQLYVLRDAKTGEVKERKTADKETLEMMTKLQNLAKTNPSELENMPFKLVEDVAEFDKIYVRSVLNIMQFKDFPGDSLFSDRNDQYYWDGFKVLDIEKQETKAEKEARLAEVAAKKAAEEKALAEKKAAMEKARAEEEAARVKEELLNAELGKLAATSKEKAQSVAKEMQKRRILTAYALVNDAYKAKMEATNDKSQEIELVKKQILLCDKILSLVSVKTNDLENELKAATKAEEVEKILGL
jgi:hypothetical protein